MEVAQEIIARLERLDSKIESLMQSTAKIGGVVENHIDSEGDWRRDISERIHLVDVEMRHQVRAAERRLSATAREAKTLASEASETKRDWNVRVTAIIAFVAFLGSIGGCIGAYLKIKSDLSLASHPPAPAAVAKEHR